MPELEVETQSQEDLISCQKTIWVILAKQLNLCEPQFLHLRKGLIHLVMPLLGQ